MGGRKPPPGLSPSDLELWRRVTEQAAPLKGKDPKKRKTTLESPPAAPPPTAPKPKPRAVPRPPAKAPPAPAKPALAPGATADIDKRTAERLRRGKLPIEARLDLHGLRLVEAEQAFAAFLARYQAAGRRSVLVITGKGPGREGGVIRQALPGWINQPANRARIVAFAPAQPQDGGHGAVYLLLRRRKD